MLEVVRILLVEDFAPFRSYVRSALERRVEFKIIGEAVDGYEAVRKAKELQPDLILLDIGLKNLSGMAAAAQIRLLVPDARLVFLSMEYSPALVGEAYCLGASGYIHKWRAGSDLLPTIEAAIAGAPFKSIDAAFGKRAQRRHEVEFYSDDVFLIESASRFLDDVLNADGAAVVLATKSHRESVHQILRQHANVDDAIHRGSCIFIDAIDALSLIRINGIPDGELLSQMIKNAVESATKASRSNAPRIAVFGECVALLQAEGQMDVAMEIERKCNSLQQKHAVDILCAYPMHAFRSIAEGAVFKTICEEHTALCCV